jgi:hypothetical protein
MNEENTTAVSALRLRVGVICLVLWWIPFWALAPGIADALNIKASYVTFAIMGVQTAFGFLGIWVAGKEVSNIIKKTPKKQVPKKVWHVLVHGSL